MTLREMLKNLLDEQKRVWEEAKTIADTARAESRDMTAEEQQKWERCNDDLTKLDRRMDDIRGQLDREARAREALELAGDDPRPTEGGQEGRTTAPTDEEQLHALARGELRSVDLESRDLTTLAADADGGTNVVPTSFYDQLVEHMIEMSGIRQTNVTVLRTAGGGDLQVPKTTGRSTASIITEGQAISESEPTFGQVTLGAFKYAFLLQASRELIDDSGVNLVDFFSRQGADALANASGTHFVTGDGSSKPNGVITAATVGKTGATGVSGAFTAEDLIDLYFSVISPYRSRGEWLIGDGGMADARKLRDDSGASSGTGQFLWAPGLTAGEPSTLLGRPVRVDHNVADPATSAKSVAFGDFSKYFIRDVGSVRIERSDHFAFNADLITWRFIFRTDGDLIDTTGAVKVFAGGAS